MAVKSLVDGPSGAMPLVKSRAVCESIACNSIKPNQLAAIIDIPRFIGELTDLSLLFKGAKKRLGSALEQWWNSTAGKKSSLAYWYDRRLPYLGKRSDLSERAARLPGQRAIGADLAWKFFVEPLVSELALIKKAIVGLDESYRKLLNPQPFIMRGSFTDNGESIPYSNTLTYYRYQTQRSLKREVHCWLQARHKPVVVNEMELLRNRLGLMVNVSSMWELIPLSFVFDMFVDVGSFLQQFDGSVLNLDYTILAQGSSCKDTLVTHTTLYPLGGTWGLTAGANVPTVTGRKTTVTYDRIGKSLPLNGSMLTPVQTRLPSFGQGWTIAELFYSALQRRN
jgi:hypothetical protein